jgi:hypothetical protein
MKLRVKHDSLYMHFLLAACTLARALSSMRKSNIPYANAFLSLLWERKTTQDHQLTRTGKAVQYHT